MSSHEEAIDLLRKGSLLLCILSEQIGADPDDIDLTLKVLKSNEPAEIIGTLNVGDIVRQMHTLIERHERTAQHSGSALQ